MTLVDLYLRLSIYDETKDSLDRQRADLESWAEANKLTVRRVWVDKGKSGYKTGTKREDFDRAVAALLAGEVNTLAVWKLDRLSRRGAGAVGTLMDDLQAVGGKIVFLKDNLRTDEPSHRLPLVMVSEQARTESANTSMRVLSKNDALVKAGLPILGKRRFGYLPADPKIGRHVNTVVDPVEGPQVKALFAQYIAGASVVALSKQMGWRTLRVRETLSNPGYAGWIVNRGEKYPAADHVERLVTAEEFADVQARLSARSATYRGFSGRGGVIKHVASGLARCGICDGPLQYRNSYLCLADLSHPTIVAEYLEGQIELKLIDILLDPEGFEDDPAAYDLRAVSDLITELEERKADILTGLAGGATMADLLPYLTPVTAELADAEARREQLLNTSVQARITRDVALSVGGSSLRDKLTVLERYTALTVEEKRTLIAGMLDVVVLPGRGADRVKVTRKQKAV